MRAARAGRGQVVGAEGAVVPPRRHRAGDRERHRHVVLGGRTEPGRVAPHLAAGRDHDLAPAVERDGERTPLCRGVLAAAVRHGRRVDGERCRAEGVLDAYADRSRPWLRWRSCASTGREAGGREALLRGGPGREPGVAPGPAVRPGAVGSGGGARGRSRIYYGRAEGPSRVPRSKRAVRRHHRRITLNPLSIDVKPVRCPDATISEPPSGSNW